MVVALAADSRRGDYIAAAIFAVASITDFVDGYLARRADVISAFGKLMDPIADKLLVIGALIPLVLRDRIGWWVAAVIILREALVTLSRMQIKRRGGEVIAAAQLGKLKTVVQLWAILLAILFDPTPLLVDLVIWAAVILTVVSAVDFYWRTYRGAPTPEPAGDRAAAAEPARRAPAVIAEPLSSEDRHEPRCPGRAVRRRPLPLVRRTGRPDDVRPSSRTSRVGVACRRSASTRWSSTTCTSVGSRRSTRSTST